MAIMLVELRVEDGNRVLEIGAGTGYNAALLAHRLGDDNLVTTVDLEPEITESAHAAPGRHAATTRPSSPATERAGCRNAPPSTGSSRPAP